MAGLTAPRIERCALPGLVSAMCAASATAIDSAIASDMIALAFDEILAYSANSAQVMRRMNALISDLSSAVPEEWRHPLRYRCVRIRVTVARPFEDGEEKIEPSKEDRQGFDVPRKHRNENP